MPGAKDIDDEAHPPALKSILLKVYFAGSLMGRSFIERKPQPIREEAAFPQHKTKSTKQLKGTSLKARQALRQSISQITLGNKTMVANRT